MYIAWSRHQPSILGATIFVSLLVSCTGLEAVTKHSDPVGDSDSSINPFSKSFGEYLSLGETPSQTRPITESNPVQEDLTEAQISEGSKSPSAEGVATQKESLPEQTPLDPQKDDTTPQDAQKELPLAEESAQGDDDEDRYNFALAKDGAKIIAANKEAKKTSAILDSDGDTFLKNECKADKWVIIELSQVTKMDTLLISQSELYSSRVKEFEVRGRSTHPRTESSDYAKALNSSQWQLLGRFNASNAKGVQAFKLEEPRWLKYLQIRQLSHHGAEAVCALNDVCVYGKSAAEDLEDRLTQEASIEDSQSSIAIEEGITYVTDIPKIAEVPAIQNPYSEGEEAKGNGSAQDDVNGTEGESQVKGSEGSEAKGTAKKSPGNKKDQVPQLSEPAHDTKPLNKSKKGTSSTQPANRASPSSKEAKPLEETMEPKTATPQQEPIKKPQSEEQLAANSASSTASRHGGSVYDMIVQELKAFKLEQKDQARNLKQFQRNVTAVLGQLAFEVDLLATRLNRLDPPVPAILPPENESGGPSLVSGSDSLNCSADEILDFREKVLTAPTELEVLQQEVLNLKLAFGSIKSHTDGLLLALAFSFLGGIGVNAAFSNAAKGLLLKGIIVLTGTLPLTFAMVTYLTRY